MPDLHTFFRARSTQRLCHHVLIKALSGSHFVATDFDSTKTFKASSTRSEFSAKSLRKGQSLEVDWVRLAHHLRQPQGLFQCGCPWQSILRHLAQTDLTTCPFQYQVLLPALLCTVVREKLSQTTLHSSEKNKTEKYKFQIRFAFLFEHFRNRGLSDLPSQKSLSANKEDSAALPKPQANPTNQINTCSEQKTEQLRVLVEFCLTGFSLCPTPMCLFQEPSALVGSLEHQHIKVRRVVWDAWPTGPMRPRGTNFELHFCSPPGSLWGKVSIPFAFLHTDPVCQSPRTAQSREALGEPDINPNNQISKMSRNVWLNRFNDAQAQIQGCRNGLAT